MFILLHGCNYKPEKNNTASDFTDSFLSKFTLLTSDSLMLINNIEDYTDSVFYGGKLLSMDEKKLIPKVNKDSLNPDSGNFMATYRIDVDSLYSILIINHPDRYNKRSYFPYLYYKKINLLGNLGITLEDEIPPYAVKHLIIRRNQAKTPVSIAIQNTYFTDRNRTDSVTGRFVWDYRWLYNLDLYNEF